MWFMLKFVLSLKYMKWVWKKRNAIIRPIGKNVFRVTSKIDLRVGRLEVALSNASKIYSSFKNLIYNRTCCTVVRIHPMLLTLLHTIYKPIKPLSWPKQLKIANPPGLKTFGTWQVKPYPGLCRFLYFPGTLYIELLTRQKVVLTVLKESPSFARIP